LAAPAVFAVLGRGRAATEGAEGVALTLAEAVVFVLLCGREWSKEATLEELMHSEADLVQLALQPDNL
jgi:hypothetical protein